MARYSGTCIITRNLSRLSDFYESVLQVKPEGDEALVLFRLEGAGLTLYSWQGMEQMAPGSMNGAGYGGCVIELEVYDVDAEYARLAKLGFPVVKPPATHPWGRRSVWFRDPDGNIVNFHQPAPVSTIGE
jgi:predicted enzyme related to lactoylglutathione lyase